MISTFLGEKKEQAFLLVKQDCQGNPAFGKYLNRLRTLQICFLFGLWCLCIDLVKLSCHTDWDLNPDKGCLLLAYTFHSLG